MRFIRAVNHRPALVRRLTFLCAALLPLVDNPGGHGSAGQFVVIGRGKNLAVRIPPPCTLSGGLAHLAPAWMAERRRHRAVLPSSSPAAAAFIATVKRHAEAMRTAQLTCFKRNTIGDRQPTSMVLFAPRLQTPTEGLGAAVVLRFSDLETPLLRWVVARKLVERRQRCYGSLPERERLDPAVDLRNGGSNVDDPQHLPPGVLLWDAGHNRPGRSGGCSMPIRKRGAVRSQRRGERAALDLSALSARPALAGWCVIFRAQELIGLPLNLQQQYEEPALEHAVALGLLWPARYAARGVAVTLFTRSSTVAREREPAAAALPSLLSGWGRFCGEWAYPSGWNTVRHPSTLRRALCSRSAGPGSSGPGADRLA